MWFRPLRWRRRQPPPLAPLDLSALDRLGELVDRIVALLPEETEDEPPTETPAAAEPAPAPRPLADARLLAPPTDPAADEILLFVPGAEGYRLVQRAGREPGPHELLELDGRTYAVGRIGPSPLPGDRRRCAFLEEAPTGT